MTRLLKRLWPEEQAENLSEYALLLLLVSFTAVTAMGGLASTINNYYFSASMHVEAASRGSLAGGSLGYGSNVHTGAMPASKNDNNPKGD